MIKRAFLELETLKNLAFQLQPLCNVERINVVPGEK
jgi:hypothetical protein